jgi:dihydrofolate reductase
VESPDKWSGPYWNEEIAKFKHDELFASDALLLGRKTYEGFAAAWPGRTDEEGFADRINALPKHVASTTLKEPLEWNNSTLIGGDLAARVNELKQQDGQDILIYGSGRLVRALMTKGLLDELRLLVYPIVVGTGKRFFDESVKAELELVETKSFGSGVVLLSYRPVEVEG